jgi:hypothetical protein
VFKKKDGSKLNVPLKALSAADGKFLRDIRAYNEGK